MTDNKSPKLCTSPAPPTPPPRPVIFKGTTLDPKTTKIICNTIFCIQFLVKKREIQGVENGDTFTAEDYSKEIYVSDVAELGTLLELLHYNGLLLKITKDNNVSYALMLPDPIEQTGSVKPIE